MPAKKGGWKVTKPRKNTFKCQSCHRELPVSHEGGTGYGINRSGKKICYECVGKKETREVGRKGAGGKHVFYLSRRDGKITVTNWPGTLRYAATAVRKGRHNIAGERIDVWFKDHLGREWHGVNLGDNDILRAKRLK